MKRSQHFFTAMTSSSSQCLPKAAGRGTRGGARPRRGQMFGILGRLVHRSGNLLYVKIRRLAAILLSGEGEGGRDEQRKWIRV